MEKKLGMKTYKEIFEQPAAFKDVYSRLNVLTSTFKEAFKASSPEEIIFTGCGTSLYLAQASAAIFSYYNDNITAKAVPCSELIFFPDMYLKEKKVLVVPFSRRSDTTEVKLAVQKVREYKNVKTLSVTCDERSKEYNDFYVLSPSAKEESIVMTKSFTSMLYINLLMSLWAAGKSELMESAGKIPELCEKLMNDFDNTAKKLINDNKHLNLYITLGQGAFYGVANECMNKVKEMSIANSEAYYSLEYRHGPMSLADKNTLIALLASSSISDHECALLKQLKGYGVVSFVAGNRISDEMKSYSDYYIDFKSDLDDFLLSVLAGIPGQLIGYYAAAAKNLDLDSPRNLSQAIIL